MVNFFASNRERLASKLSGSLVVISAYTRMQRSNDVAAYFEQEANFWWLTGIEDPDWWLILDGARGKNWLVSPGNVYDENLYKNARSISGINSVLTRDEGMQMLRELAKKHSVVRTLGEQVFGTHVQFSLNPALKKTYDMLDRIFNAVQDCRRELVYLRAIKQPEEINRVKKATNLTIEAFEQAKQRLLTARYEYEIEAELTYYFRKSGAVSHTFPVVASGRNACDLQYVGNSGKLKKRESVLISTGARWQGYGTDITRTYVYGEPTKRQQAIHEVVCVAQAKIIKLLGPNLAMDQYRQDVDSIMQDALQYLGLISGKNDGESYRRYFPHAISHGVGVDVRDSLGMSGTFQPGMILTVEPGVYIPEERIGLRLGDTILITPSGAINLSARLSTDL